MEYTYDLEKTVWDKTQAVLVNPDIILAQLAEATNSGALPP